jgi:putative membrane protein
MTEKVQENSALDPIDRAALQTELAVDRTILSVERTYDVWVKTGLTALASGIGARALLSGVIPDWLSKVTAATLILFAAFCFVAGAWREVSMDSILPRARMRHLPPALFVLLSGFLVVVAIAACVGVLLTS